MSVDDRLEELYRAYAPMVFRVCSRYVREREEAEDLLQEVFLKVDRGLPDFKGDSAVSTWIYRVAVNVCLDHLRLANRRAELLVAGLEEAVLVNLAAGDREIARIDLERILSQADPDLREFLSLTCLEGLSYAEAAEVTGCGIQAVTKAVSRFKKSVQARFGETGKAGQKKRGSGV